MTETRVITLISPGATVTLTEGTDFFDAKLSEPNPRKVSGRPIYKGNYIFGATDKGAEFTITVKGTYKNFAQKRALETAIRTWNTLVTASNFVSVKETFTGGSTTSRQWKGMLVGLPVNEGDGDPAGGGGQFTFTIVLTTDPTDT